MLSPFWLLAPGSWIPPSARRQRPSGRFFIVLVLCGFACGIGDADWLVAILVGEGCGSVSGLGEGEYAPGLVDAAGCLLSQGVGDLF